MWRIRKLVALVLLVLFASASTADALPLVWCLAPNGHNAIELFHSLPAVSEIPGSAAKNPLSCSQPDNGHGDCVDYILTQAAQSPTKASLVAPPSPDPAHQDRPTAVEYGFTAALSRTAIPLDLISNQLAELRTVVLLI